MGKEKLMDHFSVITDSMCEALLQMFCMHDVIKQPVRCRYH